MNTVIPFHTRSWVEGAESTEFPIQNLPFGIFSDTTHHRRVGVAIGNFVLDLSRVQALNHLSMLPFSGDDFRACSLNRMMKHGKKACSALRMRLADLLDAKTSV